MTNGEKIKAMFPSMEVGFITESQIGIYFVKNQHSANVFDLDWWNAEYKEPTTKSDITENCIACKYDEDDDKSERCKKCLAGDSQFELDDALTESTTKNDLALIHTEGLDEEIRCTMCTNSMKSDRGCDGSCAVNKDMYKAVMDAIEERIQPTTKNDLGVDCISRDDVRDVMQELWGTSGELMDRLMALPSVTPQEPVLDKIRAEIERQERWLMDAGYNQYNVDISLDAIKSAVDKYKAETEAAE